MLQASRGAAAAASRRLDLSGIMPPIPTPFNRDESIAMDKLADNMRAWNAWPLAGYVVQGSNGEYPLMSAEERIEMVRQVRKFTPNGKLVIAGSSCESTQMTVDMSNKMADAGADAVMVISPSYFKSSMTPQALKKHFLHVAEGSRVPVILYNMPANTGIDMGALLITELAQHPNIIGMKESGGDITKIARVVHETRNIDFQVLAGSTSFLLPSLLVGAVGGINGLANMLGNEVCEIYRLASEGKYKEATELHGRIQAPNAMVTREFGVPAMKEAMDMFGLYGGPCRRPLQPLTDNQRIQLRETFKKSGFIPVK
ncbi:4-hydroxy-2-oxoglutarate aldolase, mitochondrial-like [Schistocerca gregaria]|uniref:4-hydroxy-2-oxoglutarate aldolase, mitochondrial-like n=1 Tax=Schistocerca gregaria TaxID=7010 RepID=UPI00211F1A5C|nr:4-hydroxy-2-oxoglutarate aldolase, mitochondrial-like [Schistocerca gregaria]